MKRLLQQIDEQGGGAMNFMRDSWRRFPHRQDFYIGMAGTLLVGILALYDMGLSGKQVFWLVLLAINGFSDGFRLGNFTGVFSPGWLGDEVKLSITRSVKCEPGEEPEETEL